VFELLEHRSASPGGVGISALNRYGHLRGRRRYPIREEILTKQLWSLWKRIARTIGNFQARIILTVFYFTIAAPFGLGVRWFTDPLSLKRQAGPTAWSAREAKGSDLAELRRQF